VALADIVEGGFCWIWLDFGVMSCFFVGFLVLYEVVPEYITKKGFYKWGNNEMY